LEFISLNLSLSLSLPLSLSHLGENDDHGGGVIAMGCFPHSFDQIFCGFLRLMRLDNYLSNLRDREKVRDRAREKEKREMESERKLYIKKGGERKKERWDQREILVVR
jgi:hypothetical protein